MKKLLVVGTLIMSAFSFANTMTGTQETNQKQKSETTNTEKRLNQIERTTSSDRK